MDVGMPVIANTSNRSRGFTNNQTFRIRSLTVSGREGPVDRPPITVGHSVLLEDTQNASLIVLSQHTLRVNFRPGYCVTSHKAQGSTITEQYGVHELEKMGAHGAYVAITRATYIGNIVLFGD